MRREVKLQRVAFQEIRQNVAWLAQHFSPSTATRWQTAVYARIERLKTEADRYPEAE